VRRAIWLRRALQVSIECGGVIGGTVATLLLGAVAGWY